MSLSGKSFLRTNPPPRINVLDIMGVVERCVMQDNRELLEYLLGEGARVEQIGRPILLRAEVGGASEGIKEVLVRYGATKDFGEEEEET